VRQDVAATNRILPARASLVNVLPSFVLRGRRRLLLAGLVLIGVLVGVALVRFGRSEAQAVGELLVATVKRGDLEVTVLETGRVEPRAMTQIKSRVGGQVAEVKVVEGESVRKGQVLLSIEPTDYQRDVTRMQADVAQYREERSYSEKQLRRAIKARARSISPAVELEQARHEAVMARIRLASAEVALATARDRLRYTRIEAPFDGTIIQRSVQPGEVVVPGVTATVEGKPLLVLADLSALLVRVDFNQIDVARVARGQRAQVTLDSFAQRPLAATVSRVATAAVNSAGLDLFQVEALLEPGQDLSGIKPGMSADVRVLLDRRRGILTLPIEAVITDERGSYANLLKPESTGQNQPQRQDITVGVRNDRELEVVAGLSDGDQVLIQPPAGDEVKL
jgi:macrolide-specific efflux system membrane fusion protein